jgi:hypothetical protein
MKKYLSLLLLSVVVFSCSKYPDGPSITILTKKHRLSHSWKLTTAIEDGIDKTGDYQTAYKDYNLVIDKGGNYSMTYNFFGVSSYAETGTWSLNGDKTYITFNPGSNSNPDNPYKILKLKNDEFWALDEDFNGKKLEIHLIPK